MFIRRLNTRSSTFIADLSELLRWEVVADSQLQQTVDTIIDDIRQRGDAALLDLTNQFDERKVNDIAELFIPSVQCQAALDEISQVQKQALLTVAERIQRYHQHQCQQSWQFTEDDGTVLGQKITPLERVGLYVPGGKAAYPSSVLMSAITAKVAGVERLTMAVPAPKGELNPLVLAAAAIAEVDQVITVGGAQAIAALAYGTESIIGVDKIVGPGNRYVAAAKRAVFGQVAIDMIAGPSEILVVCDGQTDPDWVAMDLFSQAEHDELAQAIVISTDGDFLQRLFASMEALLPTLARKDIVTQSLANRGAMIHARDQVQVIDLINQIAPEHLELSVVDPEAYIPQIKHAGAIFMGRYTSEALGDYSAGSNHVLPTSGTARFSSPLGVYDFQKRSSLIHCSPEGADSLGRLASVLARGEALEAHARSAEYRLMKKPEESVS
ncbi:MAG: histidinol dehydrogenase [Cellvibrionaceae bacterium]|nr:histidinol dehydrogenase [Cellvibrionaceae bacterium]